MEQPEDTRSPHRPALRVAVLLLSARDARVPRARRRREPRASRPRQQRGSPLAAGRRRRLPLHDLPARRRRRRRCSSSTSGSASATSSLRHAGAPEEGHVRSAALIFLFFALVAAVPAQPLHLFRHPAASDQPTSRAARPKPAKQKPTRPVAHRPPKFEWLPIFIATAAGLVLLGFLGVRSLRRARGALLEQHVLEREFESLARRHARRPLRESRIRAQRSSRRTRAWSSCLRARLRAATVRRRRSSTSAARSASCARRAPRSDG